jgi:ribosomal protein L37AE/L43A
MGKAEKRPKKTPVKAVYCPNCKDTLMVRLKSGDVEIFKCENCKFEVKH